MCAWRAGVGGDQAVVGRGGAVEAGDPSSDRRASRHDHARVGGRSAAHLSAAHGGGVEAGSVQGVDLRAARAGSAAAVAAAARAGRGGRLWGGKTIFDDYVREVRPRFLVRRTFQRTLYRPGELVQCDLWEPREPIPVGHGQLRRGWVVTAEVCWSRVIAGARVFSKQAPDILWGWVGALGGSRAAGEAGVGPRGSHRRWRPAQLRVRRFLRPAQYRRDHPRARRRPGQASRVRFLSDGLQTAWLSRKVEAAGIEPASTIARRERLQAYSGISIRPGGCPRTGHLSG